MAMTRQEIQIVDGEAVEVEVELTAEEEAAVLAERAAPPPLPAEIPMHKARKALKQLGPDGAIGPETYGESWWMRMVAIIDALPNPIQRDSILDELNTAPNMVLAGASTLMIKSAMDMSDGQLEAVARLALTLP